MPVSPNIKFIKNEQTAKEIEMHQLIHGEAIARSNAKYAAKKNVLADCKARYLAMTLPPNNYVSCVADSLGF